MANINLYDHELDAIDRMKNGCVLCGGTGSGKSLTAIGYYYLQNGGEIASLMGEEYVSMRNPPLDLYIITVAQKRNRCEWEKELAPFLLSTDPEASLYDNKVVVDSWNNIQKYAEVKNAFFIFDEQRVVGDGVWVKTFLKIAKRNRWILLSATPGDTWKEYIPLFVANGFYKNRYQFEREHIIYSPYVKWKQIDRYWNTEKLEFLRDQILIDMDFRRPTVQHHEDIFVDYNAALYKDITKRRWNIWKDKPIRNASELYYCWRKLVNSDESRQRALLEIAEDHPRIIVFYNFDYELEILRSLGWIDGTAIAELNGHKHEPIPKTNRWVYLVNYSAGAEAWNCIETDTLVFYSQNYSYKITTQAAGRIDRLNTPYRDLYYFHLKSRSWIDIQISKAYEEKRDFNENRHIQF